MAAGSSASRRRAASCGARAVIVTVPTNVLAAGMPRFVPELPAKIAAAQRCRSASPTSSICGSTARKRSPRIPISTAPSIGSAPAATICGRWDGRWSKAISAVRSPATSSRPARGRSRASPSTSSPRSWAATSASACIPIAASAWARDPHAQGSYSHAKPGQADARQVLAAAVDQRLFFAGEACSSEDFSTAHGAYRSGVGAAELVIAALGRMRCRCRRNARPGRAVVTCLGVPMGL